MNNNTLPWHVDEDDEVAALTHGIDGGWSSTNSNRNNAPSAPLFNNSFSMSPIDGGYSRSDPPSAPLFNSGIGWDVNNNSNGNNQRRHDGFTSILPPTPGTFQDSRRTNNALMNDGNSNPLNPLTNNYNSLTRGPSNGSTYSSAPAGPLSTNAHQNAPSMPQHHSPYSNYESIMSSLGHFQTNNMSYGQASARFNPSYANREREMALQFGKLNHGGVVGELNNGLGVSDGGNDGFGAMSGGVGMNNGIDRGDNKGSSPLLWGQEVEKYRDEGDVTNVFNEEQFQNELQPEPFQEKQPAQAYPLTAPSTNVISSKRTIALKEWMTVHRPKESNSPRPSEEASTLPADNNSKSQTQAQKVYLEKCIQLSKVITSKIITSLQRNKHKKQDSFELTEDWEPRPSDIVSDCITVTESMTDGKLTIHNVNFDVLTNFNWEDSCVDEEGGIVCALGRLMYELLTGEVMEPSSSRNKSGEISGEDRRERSESNDGIMQMLRLLSGSSGVDDGAQEEEGDNYEENELFVNMRDKALPFPLCRLICDMFKESRETEHTITLGDVASDLQQMMEFPNAFLYGTITSRWELVFGNNHMFGRQKELDQLLNAASRVEQEVDLQKEVILISGHAGSGKSRLVQEIRKPLRSRGWTFLRCKFERSIQSEPLSVVALGLDEFFMSTMPCFPNTDSFTSMNDNGIECTCSNGSCPRKVIQGLNNLVGLDGLQTLCRWMPGLFRLVKEAYPMHVNYFENDLTQHQQQQQNMSEQEIHDLIRLLGLLLDVVASACPVLFFVDDLQWADVSTMALLTSLISMVGSSDHAVSSNCSLLFLGACRIDDGLTKEVILGNLLEELDKCECVSLGGFDVESLNEMISEVLCLPRRKTLSLSEAIHEKTQGMPLFVVELVDTLLAEELLTESDKLGWEWDTDAINRRPIAKGVADLLCRKLERLPPDMIRSLQILSCFETRLDFQGVDLQVIEAVKYYDPNDPTDISLSLDVAVKDFLVSMSGTTVAFSHELIRKAAFDSIATIDRIPMLMNLIHCLVNKCQIDTSGTDVYVLATVNLMNKVDHGYISSNPQQSHLFAEYNLEAGRRLIEQAKFSSALEYLHTGKSYLHGNGWDSNYYLTVGLISNMAVASYSLGRPDDCFAQTSEVFEHAGTFDDKFMAYCVYIKLLGVSSTDRAIEKLLYLLPFVGEPIDPNTITQQLAVDEMMALKQTLSGNQKDRILSLARMTDGRMIMSMKLMGLLVLYSSQQKAFLSGYLATRMIRISLQYGQCEDTVYAMSIFCSSLLYAVIDAEEAYSLARIALSLMKNYNTNQLIPRVYGLIYGTVLSIKDTLHSTLGPLSSACHLAFSNGVHEHAVLNTLIFVRKSLFGGVKIPVMLDELASSTRHHEKMNQISIIKHFLAPAYNTLSVFSGIVLEEPKVLVDYAKEPAEDIVVAAISQNELVYVRAAVGIALFESLILRDFTKASDIVLAYSQFFEVLNNRYSAALELNLFFMAGLVSIHMARLTRESHWIEKSANALAAYESWSMCNPANYEHKYLLLKAEYHQLKDETEAAIDAYEASIDSAHRHQFIQHEAIACEMAAHHYGNIGEKTKTREMIQKTHDVYLAWGAKAKAKSVLELLNLRYLDERVLNPN